MRTNKQSNQRRVFSTSTLITLGVIILLGCSQNTPAQWATNGSNINNTNTGNVGIGTPTPNHPLDVLAATQWVARFRKTDATNGGIIIESATGYNPNLALSVNGTFKWYLLNNSSSSDSLQFWESTGSNPRFTLTQSGNVGIGTSNPFAPLTVASNSGGVGNTMALFDSANDLGTTFPNLVFQRSRGTQTSRSAVVSGDRLGGFAFRGHGATSFNLSNDNAVIRAFAAENFSDTAQGTYLTFETTPTGTVTRTEKLRIMANGDVGIGTASPGYKLDVNGNLNVRGGTTFFRQSSGLAGNEGAYIGIGGTVNNEASLSLGVYRAGAYFPRFNVNQFGQVVLQPNGDANVGIGIYYPNYKLDVQGGLVNSSGGLCIAGDCKTAWSQVGGGTPSQWTTAGTAIHFNTGNVGIGTPTPATRLELAQNTAVKLGNAYFSSGGDYLHLANNEWYNGSSWVATGAGGLIQITGQDVNFYRHDASGGHTHSMTINSSGKVGIGLTSPTYSLDVNGGINGFRAKAATVSSSDTVAAFENASGIQAIVRGNGNVGIGTTTPTAKLHVTGDGRFTGNLTVDGNIAAKYQDVAEWVESSQALAAGTVVVLDHTRSNQVIASSQAYDTRVAGVVSLQPGITLGEKGESKVLVATTGRVKVKVDASAGPIQVGDLLVTSDKEGVAKKSTPLNLGGVPIHRPGTLIGKALEPLEKGTGEILVLLSLQ